MIPLHPRSDIRRATARVLCALLVVCTFASQAPARAATRPAVRARHVMVAGPEPLAVDEAVKVLREGGNAVDAAVTLAFVAAVTYPQAGNIGGGGYMLVRPVAGEPVFIDYREQAPSAATRDMFLDANGQVIPSSSTSTYRAAGVPGTVAGLALALRKYGTVPLSRALSPAIRLAREGFNVSRGLEDALRSEADNLGAWPASRRIFYHGDSPLKEGETLVQSDLAATLEELSRSGAGTFYAGPIARKIEKDQQANGGLITAQDLAAYAAVERTPVVGAYRGYTIISAPPSSSGGVALMQILHMVEPRDLRSLGFNSSAYVHLLTEAMKRAYADRSRWLGDADFFKVPMAGLLAPAYAASLMKDFDPDHATPARDAGPHDPAAFEKEATTHFSVMDEQGMAVANTYTLNGWFGCGAVAGGLGFVLNNEMDDFSVKPGVANSYGLVGGEANAIAARKRMLSSMTPTIVLKPGGGRPFLVLGTPGGSTIITSVLQVLLNVVEFDMDLQAAVDAPRFHHQWLPDSLMLDAGSFPADVVEALKRRGHEVIERGHHGDVQAILADPDGAWLRGASDARGYGVARGY